MIDAQSAANTLQNHPATQSVKDTISNGPVADVAKDQHAKTTNEMSRLANSRTTPNQSTATGQPLTRYHSFFYNLLSVNRNFVTSVRISANSSSGRTLVPQLYPSSPSSCSLSPLAICLPCVGHSRLCTLCLVVCLSHSGFVRSLQ